MESYREEGDRVEVSEERERLAYYACKHADGFFVHPEFKVAEAPALEDLEMGV